ncbi:MAG: hypothetical protein HY262_10835 [Chloroflexi bacterium]|nr:hypothetical protein [Chloroflexota bacterium]
MKPVPAELNLTPDEERAVQRYRDLVQRRRREGLLRRHYKAIDAMYPGLDSEARHELADAMYRAADKEANIASYGQRK